MHQEHGTLILDILVCRMGKVVDYELFLIYGSILSLVGKDGEKLNWADLKTIL